MPKGVPKLDASGGGVGNIGRGGSVIPEATRKGRNPKKTDTPGNQVSSSSVTTVASKSSKKTKPASKTKSNPKPKISSSKTYKSLNGVPANFKTCTPVVGGKAVKLTLAQANVLVNIYDTIDDESEGGMVNAIKKAKAAFRDRYLVKGGKWMKRKVEQTKPKPDKSLNELWTSIAGSYEETQRVLGDALRSSGEFGVLKEDWDLSLEATFEDTCLVTNRSGRKPIYYQAGWKIDGKGAVTFSDIKQVIPQVALKVITEQEELVKKVRAGTKTRELNETFITSIEITADEEAGASGKAVYKGSVAIAQRADVVNRNRRVYTAKALEEAVGVVQEKIKDHGPLLMDYAHRKEIVGGKEVNKRDLRETVALINEVKWDPKSKTVSLPDITFVDTQAGKDIVALITAGAKPQVSQRASGTARVIKGEDGELLEEVDKLFIDSWDLIPPGKASVPDADIDFTVLAEQEDLDMLGKDVMTKDETNVAIDAKIAKAFEDSLPKIKDSMVDVLKEGGVLTEEGKAAEATPAEATPADATPAEGTPAEGTPADATPAGTTPDPNEKEKEKEVDPSEVEGVTSEDADKLKAEIARLEAKIKEGAEAVAGLTEASELEQLRAMANELMNEQLEDKAYERFSSEQKVLLLEQIDPLVLHGTVDLNERTAVAVAMKQLVDTQVGIFDKYLAASQLKEGVSGRDGYPARGTGGEGISTVQVLNESAPWMKNITDLEVEVEKRLVDRGYPITIGKDHPAMATLDEILAKYDDTFHMRLLNEANEQVQQADIGVRVASISRVVIPAAYRRLTALNVCSAGTMVNRIEDIMVASWSPTETSDIADDMASIEIIETGTIQTAGISYSAVPLIATWKPIRTFITSLARATAKGTSMNPEADTIAGLAIDIQQRIDRLLWQLMITKAQLQATTEVDTYETLTRVGATLEWASANEGWLNYEHLKTYDGSGNPTGSKLGKLFDVPATAVLTPVLVRSDAPSATFDYGDDYTVNWPDGTVTLTAAGENKRGSDAIQAQYTYTTNAKFWSVVPPDNVTLYDHLINLRQQVGQARVIVGNSHYNPNFLGMSLNTEDLVTSGPQFTASGARASDMLDRLNSVVSYAGLDPVRSSAIPQAWMVLGEKGACVYRVQIPWSMKGPITDVQNNNDYYIAEEYSGNDVPVLEKLIVVGITDLNT